MSRPDPSTRIPTKGFTLFEVVLVLALLIAVMAISVPVIDTMFDDTRLTAATDMVRARLADTRAKAIKDGVAYHFKIKTGTGQFRIEPATANAVESEVKSGYPQEGMLPNKVAFISQQGQSLETDNLGYQTVITYLPDGTGLYDATLVFGKSGINIVVGFRALTGAISVTETVDETYDHDAN